MSQHRGPLLLILCVAIFVSGGYASQTHKSAILNDFGFHPGYVIYGSTSTDNWLGGTGNWSDSADWTGGLPGSGSDVVIYSGGTDLVYLDTSASIASLTLGGTTGTSRLADNGTAQTLTIAGALTVNQTGALYLASGSTVTAGADSSNAGFIEVGTGSALQVNGNLNNSGGVYSLGGDVSVSGGLNNSGSIGVQTANIGGNLINSGRFAVSFSDGVWGNLAVHGNVENSGGMEFDDGSTTNIGGRLLNTPSGVVALTVFDNVVNAGSVVNQGTVTVGLYNGGQIDILNVTGGPHAGASALSGFLNTGTVTIYKDSSLNVVAGNYTQITGQTDIRGNLQVQGRGMAIFAGGSVHGTGMDGGTIIGSVFSNAAMSFNNPEGFAPFPIVGNYTQGPNGSLTFVIAETGLGEYEFDQLNISGHAQFNGLLTVELRADPPPLGDTFDIVHFASESGTFSMVEGLPINSKEHFVLEYNPTDLTLDVVSGALLGADGEPILLASGTASDIHPASAWTEDLAPHPALRLTTADLHRRQSLAPCSFWVRA